MRKTATLFIALFAVLPVNSQAPAVVETTQVLSHARARYYDGPALGLTAFQCDVQFNWGTVPTALLLPAAAASGMEPLRNARVTMNVGAKNAVQVTHQYPGTVSATLVPIYDNILGLLSNIVEGYGQTWSMLGMAGPVPAFDKNVSVAKSSNGYVLTFAEENYKIVEELNENYVLTQFHQTMPGTDIEEHTTYSESPQGLLFTAVDTMAKEPNITTHVKYETSYQPVDSFMLPKDVHMAVDDNIDIKFQFTNCTVSKGIVVPLRP